jgi:branched-chain amino acid transport system ATP-binding protein
MNLLEVSTISKVFGGLKAVNQISFSINKGEILGLIGPNGSGKTTTFNLVSGFYSPDEGKIVFKGVDISHFKPNQICQMGMGRTFQIVQPFSGLSVLKNIMVGAFVRVNHVKDAEEIGTRILKKIRMMDKKDVSCKNLTIADLKRLEVARALATHPELLLLDEVMAGLNPTEIEEFIELIRQIRNEGVTIFIVEHVMKAMMSLSDRIVVIHHGEKITEGTPAEMSKDKRVIEAYLGEEYLA